MAGHTRNGFGVASSTDVRMEACAKGGTNKRVVWIFVRTERFLPSLCHVLILRPLEIFIATRSEPYEKTDLFSSRKIRFRRGWLQLRSTLIQPQCQGQVRHSQQERNGSSNDGRSLSFFQSRFLFLLLRRFGPCARILRRCFGACTFFFRGTAHSSTPVRPSPSDPRLHSFPHRCVPTRSIPRPDPCLRRASRRHRPCFRHRHRHRRSWWDVSPSHSRPRPISRPHVPALVLRPS